MIIYFAGKKIWDDRLLATGREKQKDWPSKDLPI